MIFALLLYRHEILHFKSKRESESKYLHVHYTFLFLKVYWVVKKVPLQSFIITPVVCLSPQWEIDDLQPKQLSIFGTKTSK